MNGEWTGASGTIRPFSPQSAILLNGIAGTSSIRANVAAQPSAVRSRRAATVAGSE
jgi:hypothetical protein